MRRGDSVIHNPWIELLSGGLAGAISKTVVAPVERVKLLMQTEAQNSKIKRPYSGIVDCISRCVRHEGVFSLWRGNIVNVIRYFPTQALNFSFKDYFNWLAKANSQNTSSAWELLAYRVCSGGLAGSMTTLFVHPLDFARTRIGVDIGKLPAQRQFSGLRDCFSKVYKQYGIKGLYRGLSISIPSIFVYRGLYFGIYDTGKEIVLGKDASVAVRFLWAQWAVIFSQMLAYPGDTVKRKMMMQSATSKIEYAGVFDCFRKTYQREGLAGLWRGALSNVLRSVGSSLCLVLYDELSTKLREFQRQ